jgi:hypothetical protein
MTVASYPVPEIGRPTRRTMPDNTAKQPSPPSSPTIDDIVRDVEPMGDLSRFLIDDMTPEEEDEFFSILETA